MKKIYFITWPFIIFLFLFIFIFYKVFFNHLVPFPGDLLASFYFPYNSGGWEGYSPWITHKEQIAADVPRLLFPLKDLVIDLLKKGIIPLWNPYQFVGMPLMANFQSTVFYPLNILFFLFDMKIAWIIYILSEPILAFTCMYIFLRSLNLSKYAALFGGLSFPFVGFMQVQFEWGVPVQSALWLPLILWGITNYFNKEDHHYLLASTLGLVFSIFGGYIQSTTYVLIFSVAYYFFLFNYTKAGIKKIKGLWFVILGFGIAAIQLIPSMEGIRFSARNTHAVELFHEFQLPFQHLITAFAPDFFGHPARNNFWSIVNYAEFMVYFGIVALVFSLIYLQTLRKNKIIIFFLFSGIIALFFALPTPLSELLIKYNVLVLSTGVPARAVFLFQFAMIIIASFGIEAFINNKKIPIKPLILISIIYVIIWLFVFIAPIIIPHASFIQYLPIAKRNLIFPTGIFSITALLLWIAHKKLHLRPLLFFIFLLLAAFEHQYFLYNFSPFAPMQYIFPKHPLITFLQEKALHDRVFGYDTASLTVNFPMYWRLYSPEGFDSLYPKRIGEFIYSTYQGRFTNDIPRSNAALQNTLPINDSYAKKIAMNILDIKYLIDKDDNPKKEYEPQTWRFPEEKYSLIWQKGKWKVYENKDAIPHAAIFYNITIKQNDSDIINTLFQKDFSYRNTLIFEKQPPVKTRHEEIPFTPAIITLYEPNKIVIQATAKTDGFLFLSDTYYPGWKAYVDDKETPIYRADYAFRAVPLLTGKHSIMFLYQPISFTIGAYITIVSCFIFLTTALYSLQIKKLLFKKH